MYKHRRVYYLLNLLLVSILGLMLSFECRAETYLHTGAWSHHTSDPGWYDYNENHKLLAVAHESYIAGYFENSIREDTFFAGATRSGSYGDFEIGVIVGAMYGYNRCIGAQVVGADKRLCPMIVPSVTYTKYDAQPTVYLMGNALAIGVRWEL